MTTMPNNSREPAVGILVFSAVETATVAVWAYLLHLGQGLSVAGQVIAIGVLFVGYTVEHIIAFNVGKDRPYLRWPAR
jgi:hypothetical protein